MSVIASSAGGARDIGGHIDMCAAAGWLAARPAGFRQQRVAAPVRAMARPAVPAALRWRSDRWSAPRASCGARQRSRRVPASSGSFWRRFRRRALVCHAISLSESAHPPSGNNANGAGTPIKLCATSSSCEQCRFVRPLARSRHRPAPALHKRLRNLRRQAKMPHAQAPARRRRPAPRRRGNSRRCAAKNAARRRSRRP